MGYRVFGNSEDGCGGDAVQYHLIFELLLGFLCAVWLCCITNFILGHQVTLKFKAIRTSATVFQGLILC